MQTFKWMVGKDWWAWLLQTPRETNTPLSRPACIQKVTEKGKNKRLVFAAGISRASQRPQQSECSNGRCCVNDFSVPHGMDNNSKNNWDVESTLRNTISTAANLGGKKSVWCCLFPSCRKAFTGDSNNCLYSDLVLFWKENLLSRRKGMSQSDKGPQQITLDFVLTLRLFYFLADKFFFQHNWPHCFPILLLSPWAFSFGFLWNTLGTCNSLFSQVKSSMQKNLRSNWNKKTQGRLFVTMS